MIGKGICRVFLLVYVKDFGRGEAVEVCGGDDGIGPDIFGVEHLADFQVAGEVFFEGDFIKSIAGGSDDGTDFLFALPFALEKFQVVGAMIEDDPGIGVVDAIVDVVEAFSAPSSPADDTGHEGRGVGHHEPARFGDDFDFFFGKQTVDLGIDDMGEFFKPGDILMIGDGKTAAKIDDI